MSKLNVAVRRPPIFTYEGARAAHINPEQQLRRAVMACLLWEDSFYESGQSIADRISSLADQCSTAVVSAIAIEARTIHGLRHAPLLLLLNLIRRNEPGLADTIDKVLRRADDMTELAAMYWQLGNNKNMIPRQMKRGFSKAFARFQEYHFGKYDRDAKVTFSALIRMVRPKPVDDEQAALFKRIRTRTLAIPDTWETELSAGKDKKETFERLLREGKLGYLALLRNLRNMVTAGVDMNLICSAILARKGAMLVFPFRYTAAARAVPQLEPFLDTALGSAIEELPRLKGRTAILVDVSRSMLNKLSAKSDLNRMDAAATLASVINCDHLRVFSFSQQLVEVPPRRGMAGVDAILRSQVYGGTHLFDAVTSMNTMGYDRLIVITDEQATGTASARGMIQGTVTTMPDPVGLGYVINVANETNGVGYGKWTHIDGFSEAVIRFIAEHEKESEGVANLV